MKPYGSVKLRNALRRLDPDLIVKLRNVRINGVLFGCAGFVTNPRTGTVVYVNTDHNHGLTLDNALYRVAENDRDFTGGVNRRARYRDLAAKVVELSNMVNPR